MFEPDLGEPKNRDRGAVSKLRDESYQMTEQIQSRQ